MTGSEGVERREQILETFSKASKDGKQPLEPLKLASTHRLVEGKNIGHTRDGGYSISSSSRFAIYSDCY